MKTLLAVLTTAALTAAMCLAAGPRVIYTKSFPGSTPAWVAIAVEQNGAVTYTESKDEEPESFQMEPEAVAAIFDLAGKLDHFKGKLESGLNVAKMGQKTFRWENGAESSESSFNYSLDENAKALHDWFERITESERMFFELRRAARYDKLGVHQALINIETSWTKKRLVGAAQFLPLLERVAKNETYLNMARDRASQLATEFRAAAPASAAGSSPAGKSP
jgi:hypothetical protein